MNHPAIFIIREVFLTPMRIYECKMKNYGLTSTVVRLITEAAPLCD